MLVRKAVLGADWTLSLGQASAEVCTGWPVERLNYKGLDHSPVFRAGFTSAIFLPVTLIIITYLYFYYILSRRTR